MASSNPTPIYTSLTDVTRSRPRTLQPAARRSSGRLRGRRRTSGPPIEPCGAIVFSKRSDYGAQQVPLGPARARAYVPPYVWPCAPLFTGKQPYPIALADRGMMALAGLWENWRSPAGEWIRSFAVATCPPNELCAELHNRMPVVLGPETWQAWLGEEPADARQRYLSLTRRRR